MPIEVFYSYSHLDEKFREELVKHLRVFERDGLIKGWHDRNISAGAEWKDAIDAHLESAGIILLLVSANFLDSDYCYDIEMKRAMERHAKGEARVIPIIVSSCRWYRAPFGKLQALPKNARAIESWDRQAEAYTNVVEGIERAITEVGRTSDAGSPDGAARADAPESRIPYRGLRTFSEEDSPFFFGRADDIKNLAAKMDKASFLAVIGASGSGKSSLVLAGLIPALRKGVLTDSSTWRFHTFTPGTHPLEHLAVGLTKLGSEKPMGRAIDAMSADPREFHLHAQLALANRPAEERVVWVIDQFEEVFTLCKHEQERAAFLASLLYASSIPDGRSKVLITMRADFYQKCLAYADLARAIAEHQYAVVALDENNLRQAIEEPAKQVGLSVEPGLVKQILEDVRSQPGALPLLEHALYEVWDRRSDGELTLTAYQESGGVKGAIARRAEEIYETLEPRQQELAQGVMLRLTQPGEGTEDTRRRALMSELITSRDESDLVTGIVKRFADARLLTTSGGNLAEEQVVDVSHEALIRSWPRLRKWVEDDRTGLRILSRLNQAAKEWAREGRDESFLYQGARLGLALEWRARNEHRLNDLEREFLSTSEARRTRAEEEREVTHQRELEAARRLAETEMRRAEEEKESADIARRLVEAQKGSRRRLKYSLAGLSILLVASVAATILAYTAWQSNRQLLYLADMRGAFQAVERTDFAEGRTLLEAHSQDKSRGFEWLLLRHICEKQKGEFRGHTAAVSRVAFSPDGKILASASMDKTVKLWNAATHTEVVTLKGHTAGVSWVAFSPDGKTLASASMDETVKLWDSNTNAEVATLNGHFGSVGSVVFSPDGKRLASVSDDQTVKLWDAQTHTEVTTLRGHTGLVSTVAFSPDGSTIASASDDGTIKLWDASTHAELATLRRHSRFVASLAFSPDGRTLASASEDQTVKLWDSNSHAELATLGGHSGSENSVAFSPDGKTLASAAQDAIRLWDVSTHKELGRFKGHARSINSIAFSPDGTTLASASDDLTLKLWDVGKLMELGKPEGHSDGVRSVAFAPHGNKLASASADTTVRLWDVATLRELGKFKNHTGMVYSVAFSPDGNTVASAGADRTIRLWDGTTFREVGRFNQHADTVYSVAFSPDGKTLASGSADNTIRLWEATTGKELGKLENQIEERTPVVFSPDGRMLASAGADRIVKLWDTATLTQLAAFPGHTGPVNSVAFSPGGKALASVSGDLTVKLWDVSKRNIRGTFKGHTNDVYWAAFSPDGKTLASASVDGTVRLWDVATGAERGILQAHAGPVTSLAFKPDGRILASASEDTTVKLWGGLR